MKMIKTDELLSLGGDELLEIHLKFNKVIVGFISSTKSSIPSNDLNSKGVLDSIVIRYENEIEDETFISNFFDRIIPIEIVKEIWLL
jgi:hypothetical protein